MGAAILPGESALGRQCPNAGAAVGRHASSRSAWISLARPAVRPKSAILESRAVRAHVHKRRRRDEPRHAKLHDFCMQIPYSCIVALSGIVLAFRAPRAVSIITLVIAALMAQTARWSLSRWRVGLNSTPCTITSGVLSGYMAYMWGVRWKLMLVPAKVWGPLLFTWTFFMFAVSLVMMLFCIYNIRAGGNPAPQGAKA